MEIPVFYSNKQDNNHCLQACVKMVLDSLGVELSWEAVEEGTQFRSGKYSWPINAAAFLSKKIPGIKLVSVLDYALFAKRGENYLKEFWKPEWFESQKAHASPGFLSEQEYARRFMRNGAFERREIFIEDIAKIIDEGFFVITLVNSSRLAGRDGSAGHFVLVYGNEMNHFIMHNPGLPPEPEARVNKGLFKLAFSQEIIAIPTT